MRHYIGALAVSNDGRRVVATSPRGGLAVTWHTKTGQPLDSAMIADVCGALSATGGGLMLSDGQGRLWRDDRELPNRSPGVARDNHMAGL